MKPIRQASKPGPDHDRTHDVLRSERHPLGAIFVPHSVAVIGATDRQSSIGRAVVWSLLSSTFGGTVYPVSDKHSSVLEIKGYRHVEDIPEPVDLAVVVTPRRQRAADHLRMRPSRSRRSDCDFCRLPFDDGLRLPLPEI